MEGIVEGQDSLLLLTGWLAGAAEYVGGSGERLGREEGKKRIREKRGDFPENQGNCIYQIIFICG